MTEPAKAVFLSYASQDAEAARRMAEALRAAGIEVWFDQSELRGGDVWDRQIRKQIHDCALFIPIISANTQRRLEGYFRREWRLAVDRTHDMADTKPFLVPVVIDATKDQDAEVPDYFRAVQWSRLPGGGTATAFVERVIGLLSPEGDRVRAEVRSAAAALPRAAAAPWQPASSPAAPRQKLWTLLMIAAVAVIGVAYLGFDKLWLSKRVVVVSQTASGKGGPPAQSALPEKSIAVLPFVDMSEKKDQEYFADGMAEEVIDLLTQVPEVRVIARTSSFQFKGKNEDLRRVGASLGAAFVVEGSVRRSEGRIRVTAQLIDTQDGAQRWSESYDRDVDDILKVQQEIAAGIVHELQAGVGAEHWFPAPALASTPAYELFLRGLHSFNRYDKVGFEEAANDFQQVLELEPTSTRAAEALALTHLTQAADGLVPSRPGFELARRDAKHVLRLDPRSALAHAVLARVYTVFDWDWEAAKREAATALAVAPQHPFTLFTAASIAASQGQWDEAERLFRSSLNVDPLNADVHCDLALTLYRAGHLANAEAEMRRGLEISPSYVSGHNTLASILLAQNRRDAALREMQREVVEGSQLSGLAVVYYVLGRKAESDAVLKRATRETADWDAYNIAAAYAFRGEIDQAFHWLDRAFLQKDFNLVFIKGEPQIKNLEHDARYKAFLRKMNLSE